MKLELVLAFSPYFYLKHKEKKKKKQNLPMKAYYLSQCHYL